MTDGNQNNTPTTPSVNPVKKWLYMLMGKPLRTSTPQQSQNPATVSPQEDSVKQDIQGLKTLVKGALGGAKNKATPAAKLGKEKTIEAAQTVGRSVDTGFLKKLIKIFFVVVFLLILVFIALKLYNLLPTQSPVQTVTLAPSPTSVPYEPERPSVYAEDPQILKLENDIEVLRRELAGVDIRESTLKPPILDFNINFKSK
jgi:hypothetical protein